MRNVIMNQDQIKETIPHRPPMLLVDEVIELLEGESIRASLYLNHEMDFFKGHFPGAPVLPGVLTVEAMAQTADVLLLLMPQYKGKTPLFIGIDQVKFRQKIRPGDTIEIEAKVLDVNVDKDVITCESTVYKSTEVVAVGLVTLAMR